MSLENLHTLKRDYPKKAMISVTPEQRDILIKYKFYKKYKSLSKLIDEELIKKIKGEVK